MSSLWSGRLALLLIVVLFGGSLPAYKWAATGFGPATSNLLRFAIANALLWAFAARRVTALEREARGRLLLIGAFGLGLMAWFMSLGVAIGSATLASIIVGLEPIGVTLAGVLLLGDRPVRGSWAALVIGFAGALVASGLFSAGVGTTSLLPMLLMLGTVATFSVYTANVRRVARVGEASVSSTSAPPLDPLVVAATTQLGALLFLVPALGVDLAGAGALRSQALSLPAIGGVLFLGVGSAVSYMLLCSVLAKMPPSRLAVTMYLTPVFGVLFSWLVAGEPLHMRDAAGGALVLGAVWISERAARASR